MTTQPRDNEGRYVPLACPLCGCGHLAFQGDGLWECDGLLDPEHPDKELQACHFSHFNGEQYHDLTSQG